MVRHFRLVVWTAAVGAACVSGLQAQEIVDAALESFPPEIERMEYSNPADLRSLPNYPALREHFLGLNLESAEQSLSILGIEESDIDEVVLGWATPSTGTRETPGLWVLAGGNFSTERLDSAAEAQGLKAVRVGSVKTYCLGSEYACVALLDAGHGTFGTLRQIAFMVAARQGLRPGLNSNRDFAGLVNPPGRHTAIWGVVKGSRMADWFRTRMPSPRTPSPDWSPLFSGVQAVTYSVGVGDTLHVELKLDCESTAAANSMRQVLDTVRLLQQMAWRSKDPNVPNPFDQMDLESAGHRVEMKLEMPAASVGEFR